LGRWARVDDGHAALAAPPAAAAGRVKGKTQPVQQFEKVSVPAGGTVVRPSVYDHFHLYLAYNLTISLFPAANEVVVPEVKEDQRPQAMGVVLPVVQMIVDHRGDIAGLENAQFPDPLLGEVLEHQIL
jgi:hypothetical protein